MIAAFFLSLVPALAAAQGPLVTGTGSAAAPATTPFPAQDPAPAPTPPPLPPPPPFVQPDGFSLRDRLPISRFTMGFGGGQSEFVDEGYRSNAGVLLGGARIRLGSSIGESLGPSLTIEASGALQHASKEAICVTAPCDDAPPDGTTRTYSLAAIRVGYEGRNAAIEGGIARFGCPGCIYREQQNADGTIENVGEDSIILPSLAGRLGPPGFHVWGEFAAGSVTSLQRDDGARIPAAFGLGIRFNQVPLYLRVGVTSEGYMGDVDVEVFDGLHAGLAAWSFDDQWAGGMRITVPLGRGQKTGPAYRGKR